MSVFRPGTACNVFARFRMDKRKERTPKSAAASERLPIPGTGPPMLLASAISGVGSEMFGETAEVWRLAVARFSLSPSGVKF